MSNVTVYLHTEVIVEQELFTIIAQSSPSSQQYREREVWYQMSLVGIFSKT